MAAKKTIEEQLDDGHEALAEMAKPDKVVQMQVTYHGSLVCLTAHGRLFERVVDTRHLGQPGPPPMIWREVPVPEL